ncbi:hypothetical protein HNY73_015569 [Argiope bruennichi]|uniref:Uncharacterized protein n=1 Tax=Argiope bruennichi TaxID=94029 RepID=A0A8T0ET12_ARGBR|nr:hypothetical protein HNY73_015569 [Argiope bruennichi]
MKVRFSKAPFMTTARQNHTSFLERSRSSKDENRFQAGVDENGRQTTRRKKTKSQKRVPQQWVEANQKANLINGDATREDGSRVHDIGFWKRHFGDGT